MNPSFFCLYNIILTFLILCCSSPYFCIMIKRTAAKFFVMLFAIVLFLGLFSQSPYAQHKKHVRHHHFIDSIAAKISQSIFYPQNPESGTITYGLNLNITIAPRQVVRDEIRQIPQLAASMRIGLPANFGVGISLAGNYIANQLSVYPSWSYSSGPFSIAFQNKFSLWLGTADFSGFSTFGMGFSNAPGLILGLRADEFLLSVRTEFITNYWQYTKFGPDVVKRHLTEFEGEAFTFAIEQDAFGGSRINWGIRFNYTRPDYQLWLAFSDTRQRILTPELFFGIIL